MRLFFHSIFLLPLIVLSGCTSTSVINQPIQGNAETLSKKGWWFAAFHPHWPEETKPLFYIDTLIADKIVAPVLEEHRQDIELWRFHRRAARKSSAAHRFSFLFYATKEAAQLIMHDLESSSDLKLLLKSGTIDRINFDKTDKILRPEIKQTSDHNWPTEIQKSWPHFIMGVSAMWLDLIQQIRSESMTGETSSIIPKSSEDQYREINQKISSLWKEHGQHALLHHLSALFGYESMILREKRLIRF